MCLIPRIAKLLGLPADASISAVEGMIVALKAKAQRFDEIENSQYNINDLIAWLRGGRAINVCPGCGAPFFAWAPHTKVATFRCQSYYGREGRYHRTATCYEAEIKKLKGE